MPRNVEKRPIIISLKAIGKERMPMCMIYDRDAKRSKRVWLSEEWGRGREYLWCCLRIRGSARGYLSGLVPESLRPFCHWGSIMTPCGGQQYCRKRGIYSSLYPVIYLNIKYAISTHIFVLLTIFLLSILGQPCPSKCPQGYHDPCAHAKISRLPHIVAAMSLVL